MAHSDDRELKLVVLIDADNISPVVLPNLLAEITTLGNPVVKKVYGDWSSKYLQSWKDMARKYAVRQFQQSVYIHGKNATDSAMIIDAMDLLHKEKYDGFCLVSSDSDFTSLATRIREEGKKVYGFGKRGTPQPFRAACDTFTFLDLLHKEIEVTSTSMNVGQEEQDEIKTLEHSEVESDEEDNEEDENVSENEDIEQDEDESESENDMEDEDPLEIASQSLIKAIQANANEDGWVPLAKVGSYLVKQEPEFDTRNLGYRKLSDWVNNVEEVELNKIPNSNNQLGSMCYIRIRPDHS